MHEAMNLARERKTSFVTQLVNRGAAKPDTWNSDLKPAESAGFTAHADGPDLPPTAGSGRPRSRSRTTTNG